MLSCMSCLYILDINCLSVTSFANILSHSIDDLFAWLIVSFAVQKLSSLIRSYFLIFIFISFALGDWPKKILLWFISENVLHLLFSSRSFIVLCLITIELSYILFIVSMISWFSFSYIYVCVYVYIYIWRIFMLICMYMCVCVCVCVCGERERECTHYVTKLCDLSKFLNVFRFQFSLASNNNNSI